MNSLIGVTRFRILGPILILVFAIGACTPQANQPTVLTSSPTTVPAAPQVPANTPAVSTEQSAWNEVVQAARKEGRLTIYAADIAGDFAISVAKAFKDKYGIDVDFVAGRGADFIERLKTEKRMGQITGDIMDGAVTHSLNLKEAGITIPIPSLPVLKESDVWLFNPLGLDSHLLTFTYTLVTFYANTNLVKVDGLPTSYYDLLKSQWKGKVVYTDPNTSSSMYSVFLTLINQGVLKPDYIDTLVKQEPKFVLTHAMLAQALARGDYPLGLGASLYVSSVVAEGAPVKIVPVEEGNTTQTNELTFVGGSLHPNARSVFANWFLSREGQRLVAEKGHLNTVRKDVPSGEPEAIRTNKGLIPLGVNDYASSLDAFNKKLWASKLKGQ